MSQMTLPHNQTATSNLIPNTYHFIWGMLPPSENKPFVMVHYLAVLACHIVNSPCAINFYFVYEPSGIWWEKTKHLIQIHPLPPFKGVFGKQIEHPAHMADVLRLEILFEYGGIYLDLDVICIKPFTELLIHEVVLGEEKGVGLCNAVILAEPNASFIGVWLNSYSTFDESEWNEHSVRLPARLAAQDPSVYVLDPRSFYWPMYNEGNDLKQFLMGEGTNYCAESYCVHLWESMTWDFIGFLEESDLVTVDSEFFMLARSLLQSDLHCL